MEILKTIALWANIIFSGTLVGLLFMIGFSMVLGKFVRANKFVRTTIAFLLALILSVMLGGYGFNGEGPFMQGQSDFLRALIVSVPGFTIAWFLIMFNFGRRDTEI